MRKLDSLDSFFKADDIKELKAASAVNQSLQILYLFFNIASWYLKGKKRDFSLYRELLNHEFDENESNFNLHDIPFELCNKYMTILYPMLAKYNVSMKSLHASIIHMKTHNIYYNAIYIWNEVERIIVFKLNSIVLVINVTSLEVYVEESFDSSIETICSTLNSFSYQFVHIGMNNAIYYHSPSSPYSRAKISVTPSLIRRDTLNK